mmetsp:Transcript_19426/g.46932  ORF Transcript_19426/g.46932 Transcript_19426/m.46932 type:complete len:204 (-) Transcript_19426:370-981(-)
MALRRFVCRRRRSSSNGRRARRRCSSRSVWCVSPSRPSSSSSRTWIHAKTKKTSEQTQKIEGQVLDAKSRILILKNQIDQERKNCQTAKEAHDAARAHLKQLEADKTDHLKQLDEAKAKVASEQERANATQRHSNRSSARPMRPVRRPTPPASACRRQRSSWTSSTRRKQMLVETSWGRSRPRRSSSSSYCRHTRRGRHTCRN